MKPSAVIVTQMAHPELDSATAERTAEAYASIASKTGSVVSEMAAESRKAEAKSEEGNDLTT